MVGVVVLVVGVVGTLVLGAIGEVVQRAKRRRRVD